MAATQTLEGLIIEDPKLRGGRPHVSGTGVTVRTIVDYYKLGLNPEETADQMDLDLRSRLFTGWRRSTFRGKLPSKPER